MKSKLFVGACISLMIAFVAPASLLGQNSKDDQNAAKVKKTSQIHKKNTKSGTEAKGTIAQVQKNKNVKEQKIKGTEKTAMMGEKKGPEKEKLMANHQAGKKNEKAMKKEMKKESKMSKKESQGMHKGMKMKSSAKEKAAKEKQEKVQK